MGYAHLKKSGAKNPGRGARTLFESLDHRASKLMDVW